MHGHRLLDRGQRHHTEASRVIVGHQQLRRLAAVDLLQERGGGKHALGTAMQAPSLQRIDALPRREDVCRPHAHQLEGIVARAPQLHRKLRVAVHHYRLGGAHGTLPHFVGHAASYQQRQELIDFGRREAQLLAHRQRRARRRKHPPVHAVARIGAAIAHASTDEPHELAVLRHECLRHMGEGQALAVLMEGTLAHAGLERAEVAHHIRPARAHQANTHKELVVVQQAYHHPHCRRRLARPIGHARTSLTRSAIQKASDGRRGAHVFELAIAFVALGMSIEVERECDAVLAWSRELAGGGTGAVVGKDLVGSLVDDQLGIVALVVARRTVHPRGQMRQVSFVCAGAVPDASLALRDDARSPKDCRAACARKGYLADHPPTSWARATFPYSKHYTFSKPRRTMLPVALRQPTVASPPKEGFRMKADSSIGRRMSSAQSAP